MRRLLLPGLLLGALALTGCGAHPTYTPGGGEAPVAHTAKPKPAPAQPVSRYPLPDTDQSLDYDGGTSNYDRGQTRDVIRGMIPGMANSSDAQIDRNEDVVCRLMRKDQMGPSAFAYGQSQNGSGGGDAYVNNVGVFASFAASFNCPDVWQYGD